MVLRQPDFNQASPIPVLYLKHGVLHWAWELVELYPDLNVALVVQPVVPSYLRPAAARMQLRLGFLRSQLHWFSAIHEPISLECFAFYLRLRLVRVVIAHVTLSLLVFTQG